MLARLRRGVAKPQVKLLIGVSDAYKLPGSDTLVERVGRSEDAHMDRPMTRYATTDDGVSIAYQVVGEGPIDLVFVHSFVSHVEVFWELPAFERFVGELSSWARVILFDKRGVGLSDRLSVIPTIEARLDDLRAVLDAVGSVRTLVVGNNDGEPWQPCSPPRTQSGPSAWCSGAAASERPALRTTRGVCPRPDSRSGSVGGW